MSNQPTVSFHTLYAETTAQQIMLAAIQVPTHIQIPNKKHVKQMLLSYNNSHQDTILQCAAYGFWAKQKKNLLYIQITKNPECEIQNLENAYQQGRWHKAYITQSPHSISNNSRISSAIEKHLWYAWLMTDIQAVSILHIPTSKLFDQSIIDTIYEYSNSETIVIYLSNYHQTKKDNTTDDALMYTLRQHISKNQNPETLQYKMTNNLHQARHHLHQAI